MQQLSTPKPAHAVVIGGSIVGAITAAMLADRFERVTILERDAVPDEPRARAGVPQARHVHALLARGAAELERLLPGFLTEMADAGAHLLDVGRDVAWLTPAGWGVPLDSGFTLCCATRDLIEWQVRRRVLQRDNVDFRDNTTVTGLVTDSKRSRVVGVRIRDRRRLEAAMPDCDVRADLVVDAAGRGSQLSDWLLAIGRARVREEIVDGRMTYASRFYELRPSALAGWRAAYVQAALPHDPRGGILFPVEGNRWHLTAFGYGDAAPPMEDDGFRTFIEGLRSTILADVLRDATPLTPIVGHRRTENRWRRFDEVRGWPDGLVAVGDSVCCFDPVYGQGITTGVLGALALTTRLDAEWGSGRVAPTGFARGAQRHMARVVRPAWNLATSEDLRLAGTTGGRRRRRDRILQWYFDRVVATATADASVRRRLLSVMNMVEGPEALLHPHACARVARHLGGRNEPRPPLWPSPHAPLRDALRHGSSIVAAAS
jgi:2-polyprenyl-6-methoxyphenol hydroxylase-like FAD-dependent oxidoreductase